MMHARPAEFLLIDIGNTHAKLRLADRDQLLGKTRRLPTARLLAGNGLQALQTRLGNWEFRKAVLASVVPSATRVITRALGRRILRVHARLEIGVDFRGYPGLRTLGADRVADIAAAMALYGPGPLLIADFGTAAVFNAIDARGRFLGGVIAPGLAALHGSLAARAARLSRAKLEIPRSAIGRSTREAMLAGTVYGYRGMVREILSALHAELGPARVVATGGDADLVMGRARGLPRPPSRRGKGGVSPAPGVPCDIVDPDLTLQGLRVIGRRLASPMRD